MSTKNNKESKSTVGGAWEYTKAMFTTNVMGISFVAVMAITALVLAILLITGTLVAKEAEKMSPEYFGKNLVAFAEYYELADTAPLTAASVTAAMARTRRR